MIGTPLEQIAAVLGWIIPTLLGAFVAFLVGLSASALWEDILLYLNQTEFGVAIGIWAMSASSSAPSGRQGGRLWQLVFSLAGAACQRY